MIKLTARDGVGNVIHQEHPTWPAACMAADALHQDGWNQIDLIEEAVPYA